MKKIKSKFILNALNEALNSLNSFDYEANGNWHGSYYDFYFRGNKYRFAFDERLNEENGKIKIDNKNGINFMKYGKIIDGVPYKI
jgi:hypothetical protein